MTSCLMSSRNMELPLLLTDRPERLCGRELPKRGVGGCSSRSFALVRSEGGFSDKALWFLGATALPASADAAGFSALK